MVLHGTARVARLAHHLRLAHTPAQEGPLNAESVAINDEAVLLLPRIALLGARRQHERRVARALAHAAIADAFLLDLRQIPLGIGARDRAVELHEFRVVGAFAGRRPVLAVLVQVFGGRGGCDEDGDERCHLGFRTPHREKVSS